MVAICCCAFAFLRVALLFLEDCVELQSELAVIILPMADNLLLCEDSDICLNMKKRAASETKDGNAEGFWCSFESRESEVGKRKIGAHLQREHSRNIPMSTVQRYYDTFLFDTGESCLFLIGGLLSLTRF